MSDSTAVNVVRLAVTALNDGDIDGYLRRFDPSCPRWVPGLAQPLTLSEISDSFRQLRDAFEGLHLGEDLLFGDDQFACARWRLRGLHVKDYMGYPPSGQAIDTETCEIYQVSGGVVVTSWAYGDLGLLFRQIAGGEEGALCLRILLSAGGESTTSLLGNAVRLLAERPDLQAHLQSDPGGFRGSWRRCSGWNRRSATRCVPCPRTRRSAASASRPTIRSLSARRSTLPDIMIIGTSSRPSSPMPRRAGPAFPSQLPLAPRWRWPS
jgi:predicted ester cyclase